MTDSEPLSLIGLTHFPDCKTRVRVEVGSVSIMENCLKSHKSVTSSALYLRLIFTVFIQ